MLLNFDYDGVIVDSLSRLVDISVQAQEMVGEGRRPELNDFATIEKLTFPSLAAAIGIPDEKIAEYGKTAFKLQSEGVWDVQLFPGILSTFMTLSEKHDIVVITESGSSTVARSFERLGLTPAISKILGGELGLSKSERILKSCSYYGKASSETFMIGDAISDIRQGKLAGVKTIAVAWGFQKRELLMNEDPDFMVDRPEDLLDVIGEYCRVLSCDG